MNTPEIATNPNQDVDKDQFSDSESELRQELAGFPSEHQVPEKFAAANRLFTHTAPAQSLPSILRTGLISSPTYDSIGKGDLFYSLTFGKEYRDVKFDGFTGRSNHQIDQFAITFWRQSEHIKRPKSIFDGKLSKYGFAPAAPVAGAPPAEFLQNRMTGPTLYPGERIASVPPSDFLASINIDDLLIEQLANYKLALLFNLRSAAESVELMQEYLEVMGEDPSFGLVRNSNYPLKSFARDLVSNIYHEVISVYSKATFNQIETELSKFSPDQTKITELVTDLIYKRDNSPDALSYRYLNMLITKSYKILNAQKISLTLETNNLKSHPPHLPLKSLGLTLARVAGRDTESVFEKIADDSNLRQYF